MEAQPAIRTPYTAKEESASKYNIPKEGSAYAPEALTGTTAQEDRASTKVTKGAPRNRNLSDEAGTKVKQLKTKIEKRSSLLRDLPKHSKKQVSFDDSKVIVDLYGNSGIHEYELMIKQADMVRKEIHEFYGGISHYTKSVGKQMNEAESLLKKTNSLLSSALSKLAADINILSRNLKLLHKISRFLRGGK